MKIVSSLRGVLNRHSSSKIVKRGKKLYVINKIKPRYKMRQG